MLVKLLDQEGGLRTFAAILETGDEAMSCVTELARSEGLAGASINGIGAFSDVVLRYFDWQAKQYRDMPFDEQVEVASLIGDIGEDEKGDPAIHIHLVVGLSDGSARAGHLKSAHVRPTLELIVTEAPEHLRRVKDQETGLNLIRF